ncbi:MAG: hypothetical protein ACJA1V_000482 [Flavobacteriaceae bacterium]|jgi:hypothetical protein
MLSITCPRGRVYFTPDKGLTTSCILKLLVLGRPEQIERLNKMCTQ